MNINDGSPLSESCLEYYRSGVENGRLMRGRGRLEFERTKMILNEMLPSVPSKIIDAACGVGDYSIWLAEKGHDVHLTDAMPLHIDQAVANFKSFPKLKFGSAAVGDARFLRHPSKFSSAILLLGPLYHLTDRDERIRCLAECRRVLKPGGVIFAAAISRYYSLLTGLKKGFYNDPAYEKIMTNDLETGHHINTTTNQEYFTTTYFHRANELSLEFTEAGLLHHTTVGIEGPAWLLQDLDERWDIPSERKKLLEWTTIAANDPALAELSGHLLAVGSRPH